MTHKAHKPDDPDWEWSHIDLSDHNDFTDWNWTVALDWVLGQPSPKNYHQCWDELGVWFRLLNVKPSNNSQTVKIDGEPENAFLIKGVYPILTKDDVSEMVKNYPHLDWLLEQSEEVEKLGLVFKDGDDKHLKVITLLETAVQAELLIAVQFVLNVLDLCLLTAVQAELLQSSSG